MIELFALIINLFIILFWVAVGLSGAGIVLAIIVFPLAYLYSLTSPPD